MNENDENVDPMRDAAPDVEHLRLEISENREVLYRINDVTLMMFRRCQQLLFSFFFVSKREEEKAKEVFCFFQSGSLRGSSVSGVPFLINDKQ